MRRAGCALALTTAPRSSRCSSIHLPKRLELLLRRVLALPNASSSGFACSTRASTAASEPPTSAMNARQCLVASVLPAPLSPEMSTAWSAASSSSDECAEAATWGTREERQMRRVRTRGGAMQGGARRGAARRLEDVRRQLARAGAVVVVHELGAVHGQEAVRVDGDEDGADRRVEGVLRRRGRMV